MSNKNLLTYFLGGGKTRVTMTTESTVLTRVHNH